MLRPYLYVICMLQYARTDSLYCEKTLRCNKPDCDENMFVCATIHDLSLSFSRALDILQCPICPCQSTAFALVLPVLRMECAEVPEKKYRIREKRVSILSTMQLSINKETKPSFMTKLTKLAL